MNKKEKRFKDKEWIKKVLERDKYKCRICNKCLNIYNDRPHHIVSRTYLGTRWDIDNGVSLCKLCHRKIHDNLDFGIENLERIIGFKKIKELKEKAEAL